MPRAFKKGIRVTMFFACFFLVCVFLIHCAEAEESQLLTFASHSGLSKAGPDVMVSTIIKTFLSLLSIIFIALMLYAGFNWMTAGGDEKKVEDAKSTIQKAIIGLVVIIAAFSITYFVFKALPYGGGGTTQSEGSGSANTSSSDSSWIGQLWSGGTSAISGMWNSFCLFNCDNTMPLAPDDRSQYDASGGFPGS